MNDRTGSSKSFLWMTSDCRGLFRPIAWWNQTLEVHQLQWERGSQPRFAPKTQWSIAKHSKAQNHRIIAVMLFAMCPVERLTRPLRPLLSQGWSPEKKLSLSETNPRYFTWVLCSMGSCSAIARSSDSCIALDCVLSSFLSARNIWLSWLNCSGTICTNSASITENAALRMQMIAAMSFFPASSFDSLWMQATTLISPWDDCRRSQSRYTWWCILA